MLNEFKAFIARGNVLDMAVGIIIGAAFTAIVTSLVDDLVNPLIGLVVGGIDFSGLSVGLGEAQFMYGNFINAIIKFLIIAWVVFLLVKAVNRASGLGRKAEEPAPEAPAAPTEVEVLQQILTELRAKP
ncbi:large conductance mechanosensitive channel protein MscL [Pseudogemmobacter sonorensis]|uniref:large conductance mechanosensitive channel protein MscL n=1 Tax=Pseudogemmobacter sonorensis TaxID=2989681 RepID=UPI0036B56211